uniref:hypothetical protein n=1 Tax=Roseivirga sp. TaxID=1964215 RepID=UPI004048A87F
MSLTTTQHDLLVKYLKDVEIIHQEPFEEFYDHIVTAFEKNEATDIRLFIKEAIEPAFGGVKGIKRILLNQRELRQKLIWKRANTLLCALALLYGFTCLQLVKENFTFKLELK